MTDGVVEHVQQSPTCLARGTLDIAATLVGLPRKPPFYPALKIDRIW
jgi:hypothetical protein